ncbi:unnamed protein product [Brassica rapa subsp. narinosa]
MWLNDCSLHQLGCWVSVCGTTKVLTEEDWTMHDFLAQSSCNDQGIPWKQQCLRCRKP